MSENIHDFSAIDNRGNEFSFADQKGKVLLVVNTASKCGFTPQYDGLQALYEKYRGQGLEIIGFPCDQFAHQEPGDDTEIASFCKLNYGVTFPLMGKIKVNGSETHPVYQFLKAKAPGKLGKGIKWNFTKFLVGKDGAMVTRYAPKVEPADLAGAIEKALAE